MIINSNGVNVTPAATDVKVSEDVEKLMGASDVNDALANIVKILYPSYMAFCTNANSDSLDAAFGKNNEDLILNIGKQLCMYSSFKGSELSGNDKKLLLSVDKFDTICRSKTLSDIICDHENLLNLIDSSPFAIEKFKCNRGLEDCILYDGNSGTNNLDFSNVSYTNSRSSGNVSNEGKYIKVYTDYSQSKVYSMQAKIPLKSAISEHRYYKYLKVKFADSPSSNIKRGYNGGWFSVDLTELSVKYLNDNGETKLTGLTQSSDESFNALVKNTPLTYITIGIAASDYSGGSSGGTNVYIEKIWLSEV